jgi:hypothetical protein
MFSQIAAHASKSGRVSDAGLCSPESQVLSGPTTVQLTNTIIGYLKYGLSTCFESFGFAEPKQCKLGEANPNDGQSTYNRGGDVLQNPADVIEDLATLLTSGRLSASKRDFIQSIYESNIAEGRSATEALVNAQQLIVTSPEFHSTNLVRTNGMKRDAPPVPVSSKLSYKAVVFVALPGGYDSYNVLVPKTCNVTNSQGQTLHEQYVDQRGSLAFGSSEYDLVIGATNQPCSHFAIHDELKVFKDLYDSGDLSFLANIGVIDQLGVSCLNFDRTHMH